jgi:hypothetical protein
MRAAHGRGAQDDLMVAREAAARLVKSRPSKPAPGGAAWLADARRNWNFRLKPLFGASGRRDVSL